MRGVKEDGAESWPELPEFGEGLAATKTNKYFLNQVQKGAAIGTISKWVRRRDRQAGHKSDHQISRRVAATT